MADQIPAWLMHTTDRFGGLSLGAFAGERMVGYSYALPGFERRPFLLSCGLVVAQEFESRGVGLALKLAQAHHARKAGYDLVRWTTNALASRPLRLYLSKLGARLVRYHAEMYREVQGAFFPDEVEIEWDLRGANGPPARRTNPPRRLTVSEGLPGGVRRLRGVDEAELGLLTRTSYAVEIPWDRAALEREAPELGSEWLMGVRTAMVALLARGYAGTEVTIDLPGRRSFVTFDLAS